MFHYAGKEHILKFTGKKWISVLIDAMHCVAMSLISCELKERETSPFLKSESL